MAFLTNKELKPLLKASISDDQFNEERLQNASYELTLGDEIYTNNHETKTILTDSKPQFEIKPGQFAILITKEEISISEKHIGFISIKFGFKFQGLVNISGFHVDPGFKGKLKFSVYNAGSRSIILDRGAAYFVLWISELTSALDSKNLYDGSHQGQNSITSDDVMKIKGEIASPNSLLEHIRRVETKIDTEQEWRRWGLRIIIGISITIAIKLAWDWNSHRNGYLEAVEDIEEKAIESKAVRDLINDLTEKKANELFRKKMDSLYYSKQDSIR